MIKNKIYTSFEQIDTDLKILKLQKEIDTLTLKNHVVDIKEQFTLKNLLAGTWFSFVSAEKRWLQWAVECALYFLFRKKH